MCRADLDASLTSHHSGVGKVQVIRLLPLPWDSRTVVDLPSSDLNTPLGAPKPTAPVSIWPRRLAYGVAAVPFLLLAIGAIYAGLAGNPDGGRPMAVATIREAAPRTTNMAGTPQFNFSAQDAAQPAPMDRAEATASQMEQEAGVRVMRPGTADTPNSVIIRVPDGNAVKLNAAPDRRLIERGRQGMLPRIGEDGARPSQVYARPVTPQAATANARIAILIGGLGISSSSTADAISRLPGEISLAFAPYGSDLEKQVQRARADGHEVFLQVPMEPFDYPDNDPGPHTLTTSQSGADNVERLRWVMSRFPGYVGIVNFMGARFMADEAALAPVMRDIAERGLMVVDDGSSGRSVMMPAASGFRAPALRADIVLDIAQRADAIDKELARLELQAKDKGFALGTASALPLSIERISRWARTLEQRGIRLVPVSAAGQGGGRGAAQTTGSLR